MTNMNYGAIFRKRADIFGLAWFEVMEDITRYPLCTDCYWPIDDDYAFVMKAKTLRLTPVKNHNKTLAVCRLDQVDRIESYTRLLCAYLKERHASAAGDPFSKVR